MGVFIISEYLQIVIIVINVIIVIIVIIVKLFFLAKFSTLVKTVSILRQ